MKRTAPWLALLAAGCSKVPPDASPPRVTEAAAPRLDAAPPTTSPPDEPPVTTAAPAVAAASDAGLDASPSPPPNVKVISIGMHVGGGPFDEETKKPFLRAVEPRYPELARCWAHVSEPKQADVGVDLLIPAGGGHAKVSNPRSTIKGDGFLPCVVAFFESVTFEKPTSGTPRVVSYSVRFRP